MTDEFHPWLSRSAQVRGLQAIGLRQADQSTLTVIQDPTFSSEGVENTWRCVADTYQVLKHHRCPVIHLRWSFEQSLLFCMMRPDGICLMILTTSRLEELDAAGLEAIFHEFQELGR
jgi:hypothetical protein